MAIVWIAGIILISVTRQTLAGQGPCASEKPPPTFSSDEELLEYLKFSVTCQAYNLEVKMSLCALINLGYNPTVDLAAGNASLPWLSAADVDSANCIPYDNGLGELLFRFNITLCSPVITVTGSGSNLNYLFAIRDVNRDPQAIITRKSPLYIPFTCGYAMSMRDTLAFAICPVYLSSPVKLTTQKEAVHVLMGLFEDESLHVPLTAAPPVLPKVKINETVYIGLAINTDEKYFALETSSCWVTYRKFINDTFRYDMLENGCPQRSAESKELVKLIKNFNTTQAEISFRAFTWSNTPMSSQRMYVHCEVSVCDWVLNQKCIEKYCPEFEPGSNAKKSGTISKILTLGPILITSENTNCSKDNGGCSHFCSITKDGIRVCQCPRHWILNSDGQKCTEIESGKKKRLHSISKRSVTKLKNRKDVGLSGISVMFILLALAVIVLMTLRTKTSKQRGKGRLDL